MTDQPKAKLLVTDDELVVREFLGDVLQAEGYVVATAADGQQALAAAVRDRPDLVLLDIMMPNMDGMETCRRMHENPATRGIPVIFLTAYNSVERMEDCIGAGANDFLGKPIDTTELLVRVEAMLSVRDIADDVERMAKYVMSMKLLRAQRVSMAAQRRP